MDRASNIARLYSAWHWQQKVDCNHHYKRHCRNHKLPQSRQLTGRRYFRHYILKHFGHEDSISLVICSVRRQNVIPPEPTLRGPLIHRPTCRVWINIGPKVNEVPVKVFLQDRAACQNLFNNSFYCSSAATRLSELNTLFCTFPPNQQYLMMVSYWST